MLTLLGPYTTLVLTAVLVGLFSFAKDLAVAAAFGASPALGAIIFCITLMSVPVNVALGALQTVYIPTILKLRAAGDPSAQSVSDQLLFVVLTFGICGSLVCLGIFTVPTFISMLSFESLTEASFSQSVKLLGCLFFLGCLNWWLQTELLARKHYFRSSGIGVVTPAVVGVALISSPTNPPVTVLIGGLLVGGMLEVIIGGMLCWSGAPRARLVSGPALPAVVGVLRGAGTAIVGSVSFSVAEIVDQSMLLRVGTASVATFAFASKVPSFLISLFALSLGRLLLPHFSQLVAEGRVGEARELAYRLIAWVGGLSLVAAVGLSMFSHSLTELLFQRGQFDGAATDEVSAIQSALFFVIPVFIGGMIPARLVAALGRVDAIARAAASCLVLKVLCNFWFIDLYGAVGVGYSSSVIYSLFMVMMLWQLPNICRKHDPGQH
jgi:putative peptidoglycan lipid II flippase